MGDSSVAPSFSSRVGVLSGPEALWWCKLLSNFLCYIESLDVWVWARSKVW